jgi:hypothetical protein
MQGSSVPASCSLFVQLLGLRERRVGQEGDEGIDACVVSADPVEAGLRELRGGDFAGADARRDICYVGVGQVVSGHARL